MSGEPKTFASLSSGLLARKGAARPAMRPQGFGQVGAGGLDDLGWNDMGYEPPKVALSAVDEGDNPHHARNPLAGLSPASPVHEQQASIVGRLSGASAEDLGDEDEIDETAELYEPEVAIDPVPAPAAPKTMVCTADVAPVAPVTVAAAPVASPVIAAPVSRAPRPRSAPGTKGKAAFTLRLDKSRHLKLRLACAVRGRSAQQMVTDALDAWLAAMPELDQLASQAHARGER